LKNLSPVTLLEFAPTATGTWLFPSRFGERPLQLLFFGCQHQHHLCGSAIAQQQLGHDAHRLIDVYEATPAPAAAGTHMASTDEMSSIREVAA